MKRKSSRIKLTLLWVAIIAFPTFAVAQSTFLSGKITNEQGEPLQGANLLLEPSHYQTSSQADGGFVFHKLLKGNATLTVTYVGYQTLKKDIELLSGQNQLHLMLTPSEIMTEDVIVSAVRAGDKTPMAYANLSGEAIRKQNTGQDLPYMLALTPSLVTTSDAGTGIGYTNFRIRGSDANRINITINGIPLNDAESHSVFWVNMPDFASSVGNVQVQRGVGTSTNGAGAFGGTVNMQTQNLSLEPFASYEGAAGSFGTLKNTLTAGTGLLNGKFTFDVRLSKIHSDGYVDRAFSKLKSFYLSAGYLSERSVLKVNIFSGIEKTYQAWNGVPSYLLETNRTYNPSGEYTDADGNTAYYDNETDNYQQDHYQLHYSYRLAPALNINASLHYTYGRGYYESYKEDESLGDYQMPPVNDGNSPIETSDLIAQKWLDNDFYGAVASLTYKKPATDLVIGGAWNLYSGHHFGRVIWAQYYGNIDHGHEWYRSTGEKRDFNLFAKINQQLSEKLSFYADLQYRHINYQIEGIDDDLRDITQAHLFDFFNPKTGLFFSIDNKQNLYFSYGLAHREPNRSNYTDAAPGKPLPKQEKLHDFELGYQFKGNKGELAVNLYNMIYRDQLILTGEINDVGSAIMTNAPKSYRRGIELSGHIKITPTISWSGNATVSENKIIDFVEYVDDWDNWGGQVVTQLGKTTIAFSPSFLAGSNLTWQPTGNLSVNLLTNYVGKQFTDNSSSNDRVLDPYFVSNMRISYDFRPKFIKQLTLFAHINNLFNETYETNAWVYSYYYEGKRGSLDGYFPQAGTHFMIGLTARF